MTTNGVKTRRFVAIRAKANTSASLRKIFLKISKILMNHITYQIKDLRKSFLTAYHMRQNRSVITPNPQRCGADSARNAKTNPN